MLQWQTLPASLIVLLTVVRPCFTAPSFATFTALVAGMIAQPGRRTVTGMLAGAGLAGVWHHSRAHWFFGRARWSVEQVGLGLAVLIVDRLLTPGAVVLIAVDDTLMRRSGRRVAGAAWQHDGARKGPKGGQVSWGTCFVVAGIVVSLPVLARPVCLPVAARLWRPRGVSKAVLACQMVAAIADRLPERQVQVVADAHYAGADGAPTRRELHGRGLPAGVSLTSRLRVNAALHAIAEPAPPPARRRGGRPKRIGVRLGTPGDLARAATRTGGWRRHTVHRYRRQVPVDLADTCCLWYGSYRSRAIRVVLVRDVASTAKAGYDLALITTDLHSPATDIVARYAARWSIEVAFEDARQHTGVGEARNRTPRAVERTVPFGLFTQTIVTIWYAQHGHSPTIVDDRRAHAPWYRTKTHPSYHDMIVKLRRELITARFRAGTTQPPIPEETLALALAWADAAA